MTAIKVPSGLTTAQLAERTGVAAPTLRMWETRHGFPTPTRLPGGHRRFGERDVELVQDVIRRRGEGLSLAAAIDQARAQRPTVPSSIYAGLVQRRPDLQPMTLAQPALLALTRAIEDEHCAHGMAGVLVGSFQTERFYRRSERRWHELARTARVAIAIADFRRARREPGRPAEVPIRRDHPLAREWAIVLHAPGSSACLAAWEIPQPVAPRERERRFEVLWSPEPAVVLAAIAVAVDLIAPLAPDVAATLSETLGEPVAATSPELQAAVSQAHRMLAYLGRGDGAA